MPDILQQALQNVLSPIEEIRVNERIQMKIVTICCEHTSTNIRVALVDDHRVMRQGLVTLLQAEPGISIVGEASDGQSAIDQVRKPKPAARVGVVYAKESSRLSTQVQSTLNLRSPPGSIRRNTYQ
jgi:hypothetical protein